MKHIFFVILFLSCLALTGCGGGGGGDNGIVLNPQQQEFADVVYAFATAVNEKDIEKAKSLVSTDVEIESPNFLQKLEDFLDNVDEVNFQINGLGVSFIEEDIEAEIRADAVITYKWNNNENTIPETLEIHVKKYGSICGIKLFQKYRNELSAFPPVLE